MIKTVYLDNMGSTPTDPKVVEVMAAVLADPLLCGNPQASSHLYGQRAKALIEQAREQVAALIQAEPSEIIWTSGATESNNLALFGAAASRKARGKHIISCVTEHKAVLEPLQALQKQGFDVTLLTPQTNGLIDMAQLEQAITDETILLSLMHVNNEIGVIQDLHAIGELARERNILFHSDCAQSLGKADINCADMPVDLLSFSAHKVYGPKGVGALYVRQRPRVRLQPLMVGGGQERGIRAGTQATHQIIGMGKACELAQHWREEAKQITAMQQQLLNGLLSLPAITLNGDAIARVPHNINISIEGIASDALMMACPDVAFSAGSACNSVIHEASHVLQGIGLSNAQARGAVRLSLGRFNTKHEIEQAFDSLSKQINRLRQLSTWKEDIHG